MTPTSAFHEARYFFKWFRRCRNMAAALRSVLGIPFCCFPCFGGKKKTDNSLSFGDLCGPEGPNCPLSILNGQSARYDQTRNSPYCLPYIVLNFTLENLCFFPVLLLVICFLDNAWRTVKLSSTVFGDKSGVQNLYEIHFYLVLCVQGSFWLLAA